MASGTTYTKLLNSDGSVCRPRIGPLEASTLINSGRVTVVKSRFIPVLRMKVLPPESESNASMPMPTVAEMKLYAESRNCPDEIKAKIEACQGLFHCRLMDVRSLAAA